MTVKVNDELILHSKNGKDYLIKIININEYRDPDMKYACDLMVDGVWYTDAYGDYYFCGDEFIQQCERKGE